MLEVAMGRVNFFNYFGGKYYIAPQIVSAIQEFYPDHQTYVEVFGGAGNVLFAKPPSPVEVFNDIDQLLVNLFRVVREPDTFRIFLRRVMFTLYSRAEFNYALRKIKSFRESGATLDPEKPDPLLAWCFYVCQQMSFSSSNETWSYVTSARRKNRALYIFAHRLKWIHKRLARVQIECDDFRRVIKRFDGDHAVFYLDPPYVWETRRGNDRYPHEMNLKDHLDLVELLLGIQGGAVLSCYFHPVYQPLVDAGWIRMELRNPVYSYGKTRYTKVKGESAMVRRGLIAAETLLIKPPTSRKGKQITLFEWASIGHD